MRGDTLNFHLVIDIEWVSSYAIPIHPMQCQPFSDIEWVSYIYAPLLHSHASRWADIPLITDGALVHAWHRYNTTQYSYEDVYSYMKMCVCVGKSVVAGTTRPLKSGRLSRHNAIFGRCHTLSSSIQIWNMRCRNV